MQLNKHNISERKRVAVCKTKPMLFTKIMKMLYNHHGL